MQRQLIKNFRRLLLGGLLCLVLAGCNQSDEEPRGQALADSVPNLRIGLVPEQDVFAQKKRYEPLLAYLSERLGVAVEISILPRYMNIIDNFKQLELDGAFFGSFTGALAIEKLGVVPLARPQYTGGASTYYGMVFVRKGSGIRTAGDMRGKRMVFVDKATTAGYLLPLSFFGSIGISDYTTWFASYYFSGTHEDAINDVLTGYADVGAAKSTIFYRMAARDSRVSKELEILATSPHVPANGLAVCPDLADALKQGLQQHLLAMDRTAAGRKVLEGMQIERFIATTAADYQPVIDYAADIGLDLKTYNYLNN